MLNVLDLFSGIGGFSLGLERTGGFRTVAFCEIDPYCRAVLRKHWPEVPIFNDVRSLNRYQLVWRTIDQPDVICGGFPCQDVSRAGGRVGIQGERSSLWKQFSRLIGELRPRYVIVENVAALLGDGLGVVLGDLSEIGYDAEWHCISAANIGAPHIRERVWIVAYPRCELGTQRIPAWNRTTEEIGRASKVWNKDGHEPEVGTGIPALDSWLGLGQPPLVRMDDGFPYVMDELTALGNSVVPQIPEIIGRAILEAERAR